MADHRTTALFTLYSFTGHWKAWPRRLRPLAISRAFS